MFQLRTPTLSRTMTTSSPTTALPTATPSDIRAELESLIVKDLLGPVGGEHETLPGNIRVRDNYLVGVIAPKGTVAADPERQDDPGINGDDEPGEFSDLSAAGPTLFASSIGLTFVLPLGTKEIQVTAAWGLYLKEKAERGTAQDGKRGQGTQWQRYPAGGSVIVPIADGMLGPFSPDAKQPAVRIRGRARQTPRAILVSLFLVNEQSVEKFNRDRAWLFQPSLRVEGTDGAAIFIGRQESASDGGIVRDQDDQALDLLYRNDIEFAVGHGVAVHCTPAPGDPTRALSVETRVVPDYEVAQVEAPTVAEVRSRTGIDVSGLVLDMKMLAGLDDSSLVAALTPLADAYDAWLNQQERRITDPGESLQAHAAIAQTAVNEGRAAARRLRAGIALLGTSSDAAEAFRFANRAMWLQRVHSDAASARRDDPNLTIDAAIRAKDVPDRRSWRPFQIAFICLNLPSLVDPTHPDRKVRDGLVDLLFFPTGGGKTEAYLGLTAFVLAIRRLQGTVGGLDGSGGVAVLMRYTLRLLTAQQFQRAAALLCACETIRLDRKSAGDNRLGETPFRIGMWVGSSLTPNRVEDARRYLEQLHGAGGRTASRTSNPIQLKSCPWCGSEINPAQHARVDVDLHRVLVFCGDPFGQCPFTEKQNQEGLPVITTDEEIYRLLPGLLIATVDKFAQLPWQGPLHVLFGKVEKRCERHGYRSPDNDRVGEWEERDSHLKTARLPAASTAACDALRPPDLIIQDELHLISGPLGTLVGLYETAIDKLATWELDGTEVRPKIIASTATVRRAKEQAHSLFWRKLAVFPPQVIDSGDSFFAVRRTTDLIPGRRYIGICAPGVRLKAVEVRVFAAVLAAAKSLSDKYGLKADPWMTLIGYFNALRELGGMRRLVDDDVTSRLRTSRRGLPARRNLIIRELTSRIGSGDIPEILEQLGVRHDTNRPKGSPIPIDVLLATSMLSVGVDVARLGLMVAVGQPKATAEYIQATSRVGRDVNGPGLVLTIYNWARPRDLSHYEAFEQYHATFYRHVEALSLTPFSPRALDRGLSALLVSLARQHWLNWNANDRAQFVNVKDNVLASNLEEIAIRASEVADAAVGNFVEALTKGRLDDWASRQAKPAVRLSYDEGGNVSVPLLQRPSLGVWTTWTCPMSLREVEMSVNLIIDPRDPSLDSALPFQKVVAPPIQPPLPVPVDEDDAEEETASVEVTP
jgi:hypothetical protein